MIDAGVSNRNFIRFLKAGAFGIVGEETEPMSAYKWQKLFETANIHKVGNLILRGAEIHSDDRWFNYGGSLADLIGESVEMPDIDTDIDRILRIGVKDVDGMYTSLSNLRMRNTLGNIIYSEIHSSDTNLGALHLLCLIVYNINVTLTYGMKMNGIVCLGRFLREKGDRVDFVKLEKWLGRLFMVHFASLFGNILVSIFEFDEAEIPFLHGKDEKAEKLVAWTLENSSAENEKESYFIQLSSGFIANDRTVIRRNLKRGLRYLPYYPFETISNFFSKFMKNLPEIEE